MLLHLFSKPLEGFGQTELIERVRAELGNEGSGIGEGLVQHAVHLGDAGRHLRICDARNDLRQPQSARDHQLGQIVMQFGSQPSSLTLLGQGQFGSQGPQSLSGREQFLCPFGDAPFQLDGRLLQLLLRLFQAGDVSGDLRGSHDAPGAILDRGDRQRDMDERSVFPSPERFIVIDTLAHADPLENPGFFVEPILRDQALHRLPDHFLVGVAE